MQAGQTKADRKASQLARKAARPEARENRKIVRGVERARFGAECEFALRQFLETAALTEIPKQVAARADVIAAHKLA
jgi:hypothetical protein